MSGMTMEEWMDLKPGDKIRWAGSDVNNFVYEILRRDTSGWASPDYKIFNAGCKNRRFACTPSYWSIVSKGVKK